MKRSLSFLSQECKTRTHLGNEEGEIDSARVHIRVVKSIEFCTNQFGSSEVVDFLLTFEQC